MSSIWERVAGFLVRQRNNPAIATISILLALIVVFSSLSDRFLTIENFQNVSRSVSASYRGLRSYPGDGCKGT